ncbi:IS1634 family transposase [Methanofollis fontis]|uniref:IS1634 family transposase n=1 Tax=Methanofollis fontis TaxID=2052832 RepID=UPI0013EEB3B5|nr:IS1634 family transposase [Methanofollis fontis]
MPSSADFIEGSNISIGHLGLVAGAFDTLGIAPVIDRAIPKTRQYHLTHGDIVKAVVLNGLGFVEPRLYLYPAFFSDIAIERLLGEGVTTDHLNDDVLGRTLDAIALFGPTELFNEIVVECLLASDYGTHCLHVDTTAFSVSGDYDVDFDSRDITLTHGRPKDGRWDLKQFVLGTATDQHGIPLFLQAFSGNESDKKTLMRSSPSSPKTCSIRARSTISLMPRSIPPRMSPPLAPIPSWISRVPATLNEVKDLVVADLDLQPCADERYQYAEHASEYAGIPQKWVVYHSVPMQERQEKTFEKRLETDKKQAETSLRKLGAREFACEPDARIAAEKWLQEHPQFCFTSLDIRVITRKKEKKRGRPKADEPVELAYTVVAEIEHDPCAVEEKRQKLGQFILATNDRDLSPDELLKNYKQQGAVERGFRFLKDPSFRVAEIFLKKPSRIHALVITMVICLFIYAMTEFRLRRGLQNASETVTGQTKKQNQNPTLKWTFFLFRGVMELSFRAIDGVKVLVTPSSAVR